MPRRTKLSTCRRKIRFADRNGAIRFAAETARGQAAYLCNQCFRWHLTSQPRFRRSTDAPAAACAMVSQ